MNNFHDNTTPSQFLEHSTASNSSTPSYCFGNEKENMLKDQAPELLSNEVEISVLARATDKPEEKNSVSTENNQKEVKKTKRRKYQSSKQLKKCKNERCGTEETDGTEKDQGDDHVVSFHMQPVSRGESFLNSSILDEILSEKKRVSIV